MMKRNGCKASKKKGVLDPKAKREVLRAHWEILIHVLRLIAF
jgi:hypothetical protein